jgi:hypothetical protein
LLWALHAKIDGFGRNNKGKTRRLDEVAEFLEAGHDKRNWLWDRRVQSWQHGNDFLIVGVFDDRPFWLKP